MMIRTPGTPGSKIDKASTNTPTGMKAKEEKIVVTVRLRPLNKKEQLAKDQTVWDCVDESTIVQRALPQDKSSQPSSFTFDKVFGPDSLTDVVYEGVKNVALSALMGINATVFAYGQTSSGKTYTMRGVTEKAVNDIYSHVLNNPDRDFRIKISGMEIYNENVRDLLNADSGRNLKLLDDPEKGTIVEKLVEETATSDEHLKHLISICEAQRQVGETSLNDTSSRSHQIIKLTIESTVRENTGCVKSFVASLNLVDLAGSERASQTNADGARLREGCHINLSLMTLTNVIRKLSVGKKSDHIPYRNSKLTRILQHSLGGNARTAIICTLSPSSTHFEQSRNTLLFATRAKEVTNNAQVNMIVSDKQLVKQLQKEVARLEAELRTPDSTREKDIIIQQMESEIEELKRQRDLAQSEISHLRKKLENDREYPSAKKSLSYSAEKMRKSALRQSIMRSSSTAPFALMNEIRKLEHLQEQLGTEANRALEVLQKEVTSHKEGNQDAAETIAKLQEEIREMRAAHLNAKNAVQVGKPSSSPKKNLKEEITKLHSQGSTIANLEEQLENVQKSIDKLVLSLPKKKSYAPQIPLSSSNAANMQSFLKSPCSPLSSTKEVVDSENVSPGTRTPANGDRRSTDTENMSPETRTPQTGDRRSSSVNMKKMQKMFQNAAEENVRSIRAYVTELKERVAKLQYQKQLLVCQVLELEANEGATSAPEETMSPEEEERISWAVRFKEQRQQIIELWDACFVSIIHRTQFYLLFRGEEADQIYVEVELRRLTWLQENLGEEVSVGASMRALRREREFLAKRMGTRLSAEEREDMYAKWKVPLDGKHRKLHLVNKLWVDPTDSANVQHSADVVARLVGFAEGGNNAREMFQLNFALPAQNRPWLAGWNHISTLLTL